MNDIQIEELERQLVGDHRDQSSPDLQQIRRLGTRRRRIRAAAVGGAGLALAAVVGTAAAIGLGLGQDDDLVASDPGPAEPAGLSALAERALAEIPGARQVSDSAVVIPAPDGKLTMRSGIQAKVVGEPVELPEHQYYGVTMYDRKAFPDWLVDGTADVEHAAGDGNSFPVGTTDLTGVHVDVGPAYLGCVRAMGGSEFPAGVECAPAVVRGADGGWVYEWGMGTEEFLQPGAPMEVFTDDSFVDGRAATLAIAGIDGTEVARAEFVATDGRVVQGTVAAGTLVPDESMFFAEVPGELAKVVVYDAAGDVIEDHPLKDCDNPVECEVR